MAYAAKHCRKLGWNEINGAEDVDFAARLGELVMGGAEAYRKDPVFLCVKCSVSPLRIGRESAGTLYELARRGLWLGLAPMPLAGGTSPVTPASAILIANAEILSIMAAIWAVNSESEQRHLVISGIMDMQTMIASFAAPNAVLQDAGLALLYEAFYGLPFQAPTDYIDAKFPGYQSGSERAMKIAMLAACSSVLPSVGQLKAGLVCSCEQACLDIEAFDWMQHFLRGLEVTEESLGVELIRAQGIGGQYLDTEHTARSFRRELFLPHLADRGADKSRDMVEAAREEVRGVLARTPPFARDAALCREIDRLYEHELGRRGLS